MSQAHSTETLIVGAGPAALQMAYHLQRAGREYLVLEASDHAGSFFSRYPRHRQLLSINKRFTGRSDPEYNLRHDWNSLLSDREDLLMTRYSSDYFPKADDLVRYLGEFAKELELKIRYQQRVERIAREASDGSFLVTSASGESYRTRCLLMATGLSLPNIPNIPGIELAEGYETMSLDRAEFENQSVLILGKGNSAFETADHLIPVAAMIHVLSPTPLKLAWESRFVGHLRAVNNNLLDTYHLKSQNAIIDGVVHSMARAPSGKVRVKFASIHAQQETEQLEYDRVLRCTGFRLDTSLFADDCKPQLTPCGRLPLLNPDFEVCGQPGMYFLGAPTQSLDYKRGQSAFIHGFRYNVRSLFHLLQRKLHSVPLPEERCSTDPRELAHRILSRMNRTSSLWQQVGFLADLLVMPGPGESEARLIHDLPYQHLSEALGPELAGGRDFYIVMFSLGKPRTQPFDNPRNANPYDGDSSSTIHPVVELYRGGMLADRFHVLEDFLVDWSGQEYIDTLSEFFEYSRKGESVPRRSLGDIRHIVRDANMKLVNQAVGGE